MTFQSAHAPTGRAAHARPGAGPHAALPSRDGWARARRTSRVRSPVQLLDLAGIDLAGGAQKRRAPGPQSEDDVRPLDVATGVVAADHPRAPSDWRARGRGLAPAADQRRDKLDRGGVEVRVRLV